jgi:hypothetical protein
MNESVSCVGLHRAEASDGRTPLAFRLQLQSMPALLTALTTVARLGCEITSVFAIESEADIGMLAPTRLAHRVEQALAEIIEVIAVSESTRRLQ